MVTAKITSKGQITIPKKIRDELHLKSGDRVSIEAEGNSAWIRPAQKSILDRAGALKKITTKRATIEEMNEAIAEGISQKYERD